MNVTDAVTVKFKLKLSQLIDVVSIMPEIFCIRYISLKYSIKGQIVLNPNLLIISDLNLDL